VGWGALPTAPQNLVGLTGAGREGDGRLMDGCSGNLGTQTRLKNPLRAFRCKTACSCRLGGSCIAW